MLRKPAARSSTVDDRPFPDMIDDPDGAETPPALAPATAAAAADDFSAAAVALASIDNWPDFHFVVWELASCGEELPLWIQHWREAEPEGAIVRTLTGAAQVHRAWAIRGSGAPESLPDDRSERFRRALKDADATLRGLLSEHPANASAWATLITVALGLDVSTDELNDLFARSHRRYPLFGSTCRAFHQVLCAKWRGSSEQAMEFARWVSAHLPDGDPGHSIVASSLAEAIAFEADGVDVARARVELRNVYDRTRLADPAWQANWRGLAARNDLAIAAYRLDDKDLARQMLHHIGVNRRRVVGNWEYLTGEGPGAYLKVGRAVGVW